MLKLTIGFVMLMTTSAFSADVQTKVVVTPVAKTSVTISGQPIVLPEGSPEVRVSIYEIPPGASLPQHRHRYPRYGYVLSGQLRVTNAETGSLAEFRDGDFIAESLGQWHSGENPGSQPLKLLVIDQAPAGELNVEARK